MKPITPLISFPEFANINPGTPPGEPKYSQGFVPSDTFPAEWSNYLFNRASKGVTALNSAVNSLWAEMNSVLASFGITPAEATNNQLLTALRLSSSFLTATSTTITGPLLVPGGTIRVLFTDAIAGNNTTTGLTLSYNGQNIPVKVCKDGALKPFCATEIAQNNIKYLQPYTTLELFYDTVQFIIIGNPIVLSGRDYTVHADGYNSAPELIWDGSNWTPSGGSTEQLNFTHEISENSILLIEVKPYVNSSIDELVTFTVPLSSLIHGEAFRFTGRKISGSSGSYSWVDWGWKLSVGTTTYILRGNGISQQYNDSAWGVPYRIWLVK